jgi:membrane protein DedA with SNARE-associated domain
VLSRVVLAEGLTGTPGLSEAIGYPALFGGVLLGSLIPVVPTGAVVGAAAAVAVSSGELSLPLVIALAAVGALLGDLLTFGAARAGSDAALRWIARGHHPERLDTARRQFTEHGWLLVVAGRLLPAGRVPVLLAAGALRYPWSRLAPAAAAACLLWAGVYAALGVVAGGLFDDPLVASLLAAVVIVLIGAGSSLIASLLRRRRERTPTGGPR